MWTLNKYPSGTQVVTTNKNDKPHYYVTDASSGEQDEGRTQVGLELSEWLNGGDEPWWIDMLTYEPYSDTEKAILPNGANLLPSGRMIDNDPPHCNWDQCPSEDSRIDRGLLIQALKEKRRELVSC